MMLLVLAAFMGVLWLAVGACWQAISAERCARERLTTTLAEVIDIHRQRAALELQLARAQEHVATQQQADHAVLAAMLQRLGVTVVDPVDGMTRH